MQSRQGVVTGCQRNRNRPCRHHVGIQKCDILLMMNPVGEFSLSSIKERKPFKNTRTKDSLIDVICWVFDCEESLGALCHSQ